MITFKLADFINPTVGLAEKKSQKEIDRVVKNFLRSVFL